MTSEQVMLKWPTSRSRVTVGRFAALLVIAAVVAFFLVGCTTRPPTQPHELASPYPQPKLWAVAPFRNESGTTIVDPLLMADKLTQQLSQVKDLTVLPLNRTIEAMGAMGLRELSNPAQAMELMRVLDVDGLVVGTVTAWDPYDPMKIGVHAQLYSRAAHNTAAQVDPRHLRRATTPEGLPGVVVYRQPLAQAGGYYDAANGRVLKQLQHYATGRAPDDSPAGWRRYLLNMDLYAEFVSHELTRELFREEWDRLTEWTPSTGQSAGLASHPEDQQRP